jgi:hypothetical protein
LRRRKSIADREPHCHNLVLLIDNYFLRKTTNLFVVSVAEKRAGHVYCALMVWNHHFHEVHASVWADRRRQPRPMEARYNFNTLASLVSLEEFSSSPVRLQISGG